MRKELNPYDLNDRVSDMKKQNEEFEREGYDGHNRRSSITPMSTLNTRANRRLWNRRMKENVQSQPVRMIPTTLLPAEVISQAQVLPLSSPPDLKAS